MKEQVRRNNIKKRRIENKVSITISYADIVHLETTKLENLIIGIRNMLNKWDCLSITQP